jgi:FdhD protein
MSGERQSTRPVTRVTGRSREALDDALAVERALEIRIDGRALSVTLRTPGDDRDLTLGFLRSESVIASGRDVAALDLAPSDCDDAPDVANVRLAAGVTLDWAKLERHFAATSACGLCGRAHLESLRAGLRPLEAHSPIPGEALLALSERVKVGQDTFRATGGLHAAAWCAGDALAVEALREDVGRHNAVDKVVGWLTEQGRETPGAGVLWVSGRAGAEIVLKAARARIPALVAVGAPTTLAVDLALAARLTLVGFLREGRMNVYAGGEELGL